METNKISPGLLEVMKATSEAMERAAMLRMVLPGDDFISVAMRTPFSPVFSEYVKKKNADLLRHMKSAQLERRKKSC